MNVLRTLPRKFERIRGILPVGHANILDSHKLEASGLDWYHQAIAWIGVLEWLEIPAKGSKLLVASPREPFQPMQLCIATYEQIEPLLIVEDLRIGNISFIIGSISSACFPPSQFVDGNLIRLDLPTINVETQVLVKLANESNHPVKFKCLLAGEYAKEFETPKGIG